MAQYDLLIIEDVGVAATDFAEKIVSLTRGGLITASADANRVPRILAVGTNGQVLTVDASGDLVWSANGTGDVAGPASAVDNNIAQFNGVTGKIVEDSGLSNTDVTSAIDLKHAAVTVTAGGGLVLSTQALSMWSGVPATYNADCSAVGIMAYDGNYWYIGVTAGSAGAGRWARCATAKTW